MRLLGGDLQGLGFRVDLEGRGSSGLWRVSLVFSFGSFRE